MRAKYHIYLTADERRVVINSLIDLMNNLISQGMYTDLVDELMIRISKTKADVIQLRTTIAFVLVIDYFLVYNLSRSLGCSVLHPHPQHLISSF